MVKFVKIYWDDFDITRRIIISKKRGILDPFVVKSFQKLIDNYISGEEELNFDIIPDLKSEAMLRLLEVWDQFDHKKYDSSLRYYTEIVKRKVWLSKKELKFGKKGTMENYEGIKILSIDQILANINDE